MSNLLEKASILTTPTAYDDGKILSVKPKPSLGSELVTNGTFDTDSDWSKGTGWSISGGKAIHTGAQSLLSQINVFTIGSKYKISFDLSDADSSNYIRLLTSHYVGGGNFITNGSQVVYVTSNITQLYIYGVGDITIDNVSVKEVIDADFDFTRGSSATRVNAQGLVEDVQILSSNLVQNGDFSQEGSELVTNGDFATDSDWNLETTWTIENGVANGNGAVGSTEELTQPNIFTLGKTYKVVYEILNYVSGNIQFQFSGGSTLSGTTRSSNGTYTEYVVATANHTLLKFKAGSAFNGSIDNVSVKEVGQDWTLGTGWSIEDGKVYFDNPTGTELYQSLSTTASKYRISFDLDITSGTIQTSFSSPSTSTIKSFTTSGIKTVDITTTASFSRFRFVGVGGSVFNIDNISVIEITDDTNLPRINYEGFSYQDALGSELVVNGGFDTDISGWTKGSGNTNPISWDSGKMKVTNDVALLNSARQTIVTEIGKTYKVSADVDSTNGVNPRLATSNPTTAIIGTSGTIETLSYTFVATSTFSEINLYNWQNTLGAYNLWDNVSVKEVTGQEVVPDSGYGSWLFEPQSTNIITYSEDYSNSFYVKDSGVSVGTTNNSSPSINANATKIDVTNNGRIYANIATNTYYTTVFIKSGTFSHFKFAGSNIDLIAETNSNGTIQSFGNGWYRIGKSYTGNRPFQIQAYPDGTYSSHTTSGNYFIWGAQAEVQSFATSYIPTSGSTVTRLQDAAFGSGSSDLINSTEGVLYAEILRRQEINDNYDLITLNNGASNSDANSVSIGFDINSDDFFIRVKANGVSVFFNSNISASANQFHKVALKYKSGDCAVWIDGVEQGTGTTTFTFTQTLDNLTFDKGNSTLNFYGKTKALAVFKEALTDEELTCLTTI